MVIDLHSEVDITTCKNAIQLSITVCGTKKNHDGVTCLLTECIMTFDLSGAVMYNGNKMICRDLIVSENGWAMLQESLSCGLGETAYRKGCVILGVVTTPLLVQSLFQSSYLGCGCG